MTTGVRAEAGGVLPRPFDDTAFEDESADGWPASLTDHRRRARAVAIQILYEVDLTRRDAVAVMERRIVDDATPNLAIAYVRAIVRGIVDHLPELDRALIDGAPQWPLARIDPVERAILRIAVLEMTRSVGLNDLVPVRVAINEAIELAKLFGHQPSPSFVNGVLGAVARALPAEVTILAPDGFASQGPEPETA